MGSQPGKKVLIWLDGAVAAKKNFQEPARCRVSYSVEHRLPTKAPKLYRILPSHVWEQAYDPDGGPRHGAGAEELTGPPCATPHPHAITCN